MTDSICDILRAKKLVFGHFDWPLSIKESSVCIGLTLLS